MIKTPKKSQVAFLQIFFSCHTMAAVKFFLAVAKCLFYYCTKTKENLVDNENGLHQRLLMIILIGLHARL